MLQGQKTNKDYFEVRKRTEDLCAPLKTEDYVPQSADFASPPKWHLAHTTWFFEEMILKKQLSNYAIYHPDFSFLFNSYYNAVGERIERGHRGLMTRPTVEEVYDYRKYVDKHMLQLLEGNLSKEVQDLIVLGLNHEQQHQELLLTDLKYALSLNPLHPVYKEAASLVDDVATSEGWERIEAGNYEIGYNGEGFCYDLELSRHTVYLHAYEIAKSCVSNGEYMEFMASGGYENAALWLDEGYAWVKENAVSCPLYWFQSEGKWFQYTLEGKKEVDPLATLCHVSYYEAAAFALWKGMRLPTEFEWEIASDKFAWGKRWEWTNSAFLPYPRFQVAEGAVGEYNGKFMVNQMVLRGASVATSEGHSRKSYRNFFHASTQWQFSGIRLARDVE